MMTLGEAAAVLGAQLRGEDVTFTRVSTDTRALKAGDLFVALRGENFDAHDFLEQARSAGAVGALTAKTHTAALPLPSVVVEDTRLALGRLAAHWRSRFSLPLIALTGSSGKTTVKEMLAAILREAADANATSASAAETVLATRGNLNNDIGVPLMLLELNAGHRYAVIEMGMNHAGEIAYLTRLAAPEVALVNNAGRAHIEFLGSEEAIARAKGEIFEGLRDGGVAVINADDRYAPMWRALARERRRIEFGLQAAADVTATYRQHALESELRLKTPHGAAMATLRAPGVHNVRNALAAAAAAVALDVPVKSIAAGITRYSGIKGRLQMKPGLRGAALIDDTYNANPESMRAAIDVLGQATGRKLLVLGDMGELGATAPQLHVELGAYAKNAGIDELFTLGQYSEGTARAFGAAGRHFANVEDLVAAVAPLLAPDVSVLVKGSRFMKMERVVASLAAGEGEATGERRDEREKNREARGERREGKTQ
jgi:UDP-N-acetylmuramoyl-tripeptide--D-alanyl-D-alanine ligase